MTLLSSTCLFTLVLLAEYVQTIKITITPVKVGLNSTIVCIYDVPGVTPSWEFNGQNITDNDRFVVKSN